MASQTGRARTRQPAPSPVPDLFPTVPARSRNRSRRLKKVATSVRPITCAWRQPALRLDHHPLGCRSHSKNRVKHGGCLQDRPLSCGFPTILHRSECQVRCRSVATRPHAPPRAHLKPRTLLIEPDQEVAQPVSRLDGARLGEATHPLGVLDLVDLIVTQARVLIGEPQAPAKADDTFELDRSLVERPVAELQEQLAVREAQGGMPFGIRCREGGPAAPRTWRRRAEAALGRAPTLSARVHFAGRSTATVLRPSTVRALENSCSSPLASVQWISTSQGPAASPWIR